MLALIQTRWQMRMLAGAPRVLVTLKVFLVTLHNETTKHTWRESARVYKKRNFHNGGAQGPPVEAHVAWSGSLPRPGHVRFKRHPAAQRRCRRSRKTHATFGFGFGVFAVGAEHIAVGETRGEPHHLVLLLMQGTAVGVDNMFKAKLFELFAIFTAAHVPRCT